MPTASGSSSPVINKFPPPSPSPSSSSEIIDVFDSDEEGWQDMPVIHEDELRGGLDEEDQRRYHYRPNPTHSTASSSTHTAQSTGNATGTTLDTDEAGYRWRSNPTMAAAHSSALSPDGSLHSFTTESNYTRLRHVEEDWEESDALRKSTAVLFDDDYGDEIDDRKALTPLSQMQQTKSLLSESQRIAYVGLCALVVRAMLTDISIRDAPKSKSKGPSKPPPIRKEFSPAVKSMSLWALKILGRLYYHIGLETAEQKMIESLGEHGVEPSDLVPSLCEMKSVPRAGRGGWGASTTTVDDSEPDNLTLDMRYTLLCDLFLLLIADSVYDSRSRHLLFRVARYLGLSPIDAVSFESRVTEAVGISEETEGGGGLQTNEVAVQAQITATRKRRIALLGLATLGGGLVIGLSAGLLAPVIGVGLGTAFGTIGISGASTFLAGSAGAAVITTGGVLTGASIAGQGMMRRTKVVTTFDVLPVHKNGRVGCVLSVPGFLNGPLDDPRLPFSVLDPIVGDVFSVLWEPEMIRETGSALKILTGEVLSQIGQTVLQATVMATLMTALQWPIILTKLGYLIDNPWSNALDRARAAGLVLASVLRDRQLGVRPVTLVGFSLGARVIFYALLDLFRTSSFGIVEDVYLMGATLSVGVSQWYKARSVVGGRFVNVYARNDWVLNYLFRASSAATGNVSTTVAGLRPILDVPGLENVDVTDKIAGHMSYRVYMPVILEELGFRVTERWFDEVEEVDFEGDRVVISPEEEEAENRKRSWFGLGRRKSSSKGNTNMSSKFKSNVQRPPSWASWADKEKEKQTKKVDVEDDELPPRESTPVPRTTGSNNPSRSSTPTPGSTNATPVTPDAPANASTSTSLPATAGFDFAAIKAELAELDRERDKEMDAKTKAKISTTAAAAMGGAVGLGLDALPQVEAPRIGNGMRMGAVQEQEEEDLEEVEDPFNPPPVPLKNTSASLAYNPFASGNGGSGFSSFGVFGSNEGGLSFGGADGSITSLGSETDPWQVPVGKENPWG